MVWGKEAGGGVGGMDVCRNKGVTYLRGDCQCLNRPWKMATYFLPTDSVVKICCSLQMLSVLEYLAHRNTRQDAPAGPGSWWIAEECGTSKVLSVIALTSYPTLAPCTSHARKVCCCCQKMAMQNYEISLILAFAEVSVRWRGCQDSKWGRRCTLEMLTMSCALENKELCSFVGVCYFSTGLPGCFLLEELHSSGLGSRGMGQPFLPLFCCSALVLSFTRKVIVAL